MTFRYRRPWWAPNSRPSGGRCKAIASVAWSIRRTRAKSEDDLQAEYRGIAERRVRLGLLLAEVGRLNELEVSQEEVTGALYREASRFPGQEQQVVPVLSEQSSGDGPTSRAAVRGKGGRFHFRAGQGRGTRGRCRRFEGRGGGRLGRRQEGQDIGAAKKPAKTKKPAAKASAKSGGAAKKAAPKGQAGTKGKAAKAADAG